MNRFSYQLYEMAHLAVAPARAMADATRMMFKNPVNPMAHTIVGRNIAASAELFERLTRRYGKPEFGLDEVSIDGKFYPVRENIVWEKPFCRLLHFQRDAPAAGNSPVLLIVAPLSGHYATLLRGTVEAFLPHFDVYITDWTDARLVPLSEGLFDLDDYIDYLTDMLQHLKQSAGGRPVHSIGVCQPSVPLLAAVSLMSENGDDAVPASMTLMGGPIDTRRSPTMVNTVAMERGLDWFHRNCIISVPFPYPGVGRHVYPGFFQLSGFMGMNLDKHMNAHLEMFNHLVDGDGDSAEKHREFYDEYLSVMDLDAAYYLQTVETVFIEHALPNGTMKHREQLVRPAAITGTALMTVEGENDDISGVGQTYAAQSLCENIPDDMRMHHLQKNVGHYGVFNGSRFRKEIVPRIIDFTNNVGKVSARKTRTAKKKS
jgi:poly(3-hydroxybutyrate) depolymerase